MIQVQDLLKTFDGFPALDHVNMHVQKGSIYGVVGPNGAGKTTIIRHITGIIRPDSGNILIDGQPVWENPEIKSRMAYIPDDLYYFPQASTDTMKRYYQSLYPDFDGERFEKLRAFFPGINPRTQIRRLSKGMQKQALFWLSLSCRPDLLILDEPVDGLDPVMRRQIWSLIMQETSERQMTVLISSHNLRELEDVCDHVGIMHRGKMILEQSLADLQEGLTKVQIAFPTADMPELPEELEVLHHQNTGRVHSLIIRSSPASARRALEALSPLLLDLLPLSLEEIFIYELGGMDYEIKDILL